MLGVACSRAGRALSSRFPRRAEPGGAPPADPSTFRFPPTPRPRTQVLFVMQDTATHAAAKRLLEDIGYEGTSARPIERWFFSVARRNHRAKIHASGVVGVRAFTRRARGREARERRATRPHVLCARGDPAGHAGALQIGAFARHASPRHVAPPSIHHPSLGRTRMWEWQHDTLGTDARALLRRDWIFLRRSGRDELKKTRARVCSRKLTATAPSRPQTPPAW